MATSKNRRGASDMPSPSVSKMRAGRASACLPNRGPSIQGNTLLLDENQDYYADLESLHKEALAASTAPGIVLKYMHDKEWLLGVEDRNGLQADIQALHNNVARAKEELNRIHASWLDARAKATSVNTPDALAQVLDFSMEYNNWMGDWVRITMTSIDSVLEHFRKQGRESIGYVSPYSQQPAAVASN